jgi:hypothetical protein
VENNHFQYLCENSIGILDNQELKKCVICKWIEILKSDLDEFNHILETACRQEVKEVIRAEMKVVLAKIESIKASTYN